MYSKKEKGYGKKENMESVLFSLDTLKLLLWGLSPSFCFMRKKLRLYVLNSDRLELQLHSSTYYLSNSGKGA